MSYAEGMLICPHCQKVITPQHQRDGCPYRFSRRFFFGAMAGLAGAMAMPEVWEDPNILRKGDVLSLVITGKPPSHVYIQVSAHPPLITGKPPTHVYLQLPAQAQPPATKWDPLIFGTSQPANGPLFIAPRDIRIELIAGFSPHLGQAPAWHTEIRRAPRHRWAA